MPFAITWYGGVESYHHRYDKFDQVEFSIMPLNSLHTSAPDVGHPWIW